MKKHTDNNLFQEKRTENDDTRSADALSRDIIRIVLLWGIVIVVSIAAVVTLNTLRFKLIHTIEYPETNPHYYARAVSAEGEKYYKKCLAKEEKNELKKDDPDLKKAQSLFKKSLAINPDNPNLYLKLAHLASLESNEIEMTYYLGLDYMSRDFFDQAIQKFRDVIERDPSHVETREKLARALWKARRLEEAESLINETIAQFPEFDLIYQLRGELYLSEGHTELAKVAFTKTLEVNPSNVPTAKLLTHIYFVEDNHEKALACLESVEASAPYDANLKHLIGRALYLMGRYDECLEKYKQALRLNRRSAPLYLDFAKLYDKLDKTHYSNMMLQKAIDLDPSIKSREIFKDD